MKAVSTFTTNKPTFFRKSLQLRRGVKFNFTKQTVLERNSVVNDANNVHGVSLFPGSINGTRFVRALSGNGRTSFEFGIYLDKEGKHLVCKLWGRPNDDLKLKWINNEINSYRILKKVYANNGELLENTFPNIRFPRLHYSAKEKNRAYLLIEFIQSNKLADYPLEVKVEVYGQIIEYLKNLSTMVDLNTIEISRRSVRHYFILFHYYFLMAVLKYPELFVKFIEILPKFYWGLLSMKLNDSEGLVLRDISPEDNIYYKNGKIIIIDLESMTITNRIIQIANMLLSEYENKKFKKMFLLTNAVKEMTSDGKYKSALRAMLVYGTFVEIIATYKKDREKIKKSAIEMVKMVSAF